MSYLLDTNVLSEKRRPAPDPWVGAWLAQVSAYELYISVVTLGEVRRGISKLQRRHDHRQAAAVELWLATTRRQFADRVVPVTAEVAERWGHHDTARSVPTADGLIAATAEVHGWTLVSRNVKDFEHTGVRLLNPFTER